MNQLKEKIRQDLCEMISREKSINILMERTPDLCEKSVDKHHPELDDVQRFLKIEETKEGVCERYRVKERMEDLAEMELKIIHDGIFLLRKSGVDCDFWLPENNKERRVVVDEVITALIGAGIVEDDFYA